MEDNILDFNKALNQLSQIANNYSFDVWIPSENKSIKFNEIKFNTTNN